MTRCDVASEMHDPELTLVSCVDVDACFPPLILVPRSASLCVVSSVLTFSFSLPILTLSSFSAVMETDQPGTSEQTVNQDQPITDEQIMNE